jgi:hypothetical protein
MIPPPHAELFPRFTIASLPMKLSSRFACRTLVASVFALTAGCQSIEETSEERHRYEATVRQRPEIFSLLENNERMEQSSIPAPSPSP